MASTAGPSSSPARDEAGPLPSKVGELHYAGSSTPPASRDVPDTEGDITEAAATASPVVTSPTPATSRTGTTISSSTTAPAASQSTTTLPQKHYPWYKRVFSGKGAPLVLGFRGPTLIRLFVLLSLIGGMSATWALSSARIAIIVRAAQDKVNKNTGDQMAEYMGVFLHVAFAVVILVLLIFTERCAFVLRAERWIHIHPGESLPLHHGGNRVARPSGGLSAAPWNRPPLPTYAAALGYNGTGDVEDDTIAAPPPPAYGNTRGSVLLLVGALRRVSGSSLANRLSQLRSPMSPRTPRTPREFQQIPESRPVSYISTDGFEDVQRAHQLEMSLARLEAGTASSSQAPTNSAPSSRR